MLYFMLCYVKLCQVMLCQVSHLIIKQIQHSIANSYLYRNTQHIQMISLNDQIKKFEKTVYNKELDEFIPIDDKFTGGGLTIQSLIQQNAFILNQLKNIKGVFLNYCKLNQNVYTKIIEHQLNIHNQSNKLNTLAAGIDRKLDQTVKYVKEVYEDTLNQNKQSKHMVEDIVKPIEQQIRKKVDEKAFAKQIKLILEQYDQNGGLSDSQNSIPNVDVNGNIIPKKRGKGVASEQFQDLKNKFGQLFIQVGSKFESVEQKSQQHVKRLYSNTAYINKLNQITQNHNNQIKRLYRQSQQQRDYFNKQSQKLGSQIVSRTNDKVWESKQTIFFQKVVKGKIQNLNKIIIQNQKQNNRSFAQLPKKFQSIDDLISQERKRISEAEANLNEVQINITKMQKDICEEHQKNQTEHKIIIEKIQQKTKLLNKNIQENYAVLSSELQKHQNTINSLSITIQETVVKGVTKKVMAQIKIIQSQILAAKNNAKDIKDQIDFQSGQTNNIKQILSKKANFTDVIQNFQKKLDKEQMKEFMEKLDTAPSNFYKNTILNSQEFNRRTIISDRSKPKATTTRSFFTPVHREQSPECKDRHSTKLFMCGFDDEFDNKQLVRASYTQGARRKKMKSTTGILNALNL